MRSKGSPRASTRSSWWASSRGSDRVEGSFSVFQNQPPVVTFLTPAEGGVVLENATFELVVQVEDADAVPGRTGITLSWAGVAAGVVAAPGSMSASGEVRFVAGPLVPGDYTVGLVATDAHGATGEGSAAFSTTTGTPTTTALPTPRSAAMTATITMPP